MVTCAATERLLHSVPVRAFRGESAPRVFNGRRSQNLWSVASLSASPALTALEHWVSADSGKRATRGITRTLGFFGGLSAKCCITLAWVSLACACSVSSPAESGISQAGPGSGGEEEFDLHVQRPVYEPPAPPPPMEPLYGLGQAGKVRGKSPERQLFLGSGIVVSLCLLLLCVGCTGPLSCS